MKRQFSNKWIAVTAGLLLATAVYGQDEDAPSPVRFELATANIAEIQAAKAAGALTSEKLVAMYLARIEAYDKQGPALNTVITLNEQAMAQARALDQERLSSGPRSPLHGIPIVIKDLVDVAGMPTSAGFVPFGTPVPQRDATIIARLKAAGAIILAKVSTSNWFGNGFDETHPIGATLNPYNLRYSPGGSSNGTGAAMAAWFATAGIGTDTGGSVQIPAAYNSITGMVATPGLVSRAGIMPRGATQDRAGPMARNVYDLSVMLSVMAGWDAEDYVTAYGMGQFPQSDWPEQVIEAGMAGQRIGVLREMLHEGPEHKEGLAIFEQSLDNMRAAGALVIDPVITGLDLKTLATSAVGRTAEYEKLHIQNAYFARLGSAAKYKTVQEMIESVGREKFSPAMIASLTLPAPADSPDYLARLKNRDMMNRLINETMERLDLDALVLPFRSQPPPGLKESGGGGNSLSSNNGLPAIIVPGGYTTKNLPIAIQFVGRNFDDMNLLKVAFAYEQVSQRRKPPKSTPALIGESFEY